MLVVCAPDVDMLAILYPLVFSGRGATGRPLRAAAPVIDLHRDVLAGDQDGPGTDEQALALARSAVALGQ